MQPAKVHGSGERRVVKTVRGRPTSDGAGVRLNRVMGTPQLPDLDPFLMLDEFRSDDAHDYIAGFPNHPHRGFETVTYMLAGRMRHGDNQGNSGLLTAGSVQWMTAGRGIVHSEMPEQEDGLMWGFQLWVNLPAKDKMVAPRYQDIGPESIPVVEVADGVRVKVVAGEVSGARGPVSAVATEPVYLDIELQPGAEYVAELPSGHNAFAYLYAGTADIGSPAERTAGRELAVLEQGGDSVHLAAAGDEPARLLLVAGRPLGEPVTRYGPFVMNTEREIHEAVADFQAGRL
ncbi:MAG TPA: pirin family protein [Gammaproteobacteria bacterium]|nr:pirin family protein [Gammaproteobacteria bacterium]